MQVLCDENTMQGSYGVTDLKAAIFRNHTVQMTMRGHSEAWENDASGWRQRDLDLFVCFWKLSILMIQNILLIKYDSNFFTENLNVFQCESYIFHVLTTQITEDLTKPA